MAGKLRNKLSIILAVFCVACLAVGIGVYQYWRVNETTVFLPKNETEVPIHLSNYVPIQPNSWGFDEPTARIREYNPFAAYWCLGGNTDIVLKINGKTDLSMTDIVQVPMDFTYPLIEPHSVQKITLALQDYGKFSIDSDGRMCWIDSKLISPNFTESDMQAFAELAMVNIPSLYLTQEQETAGWQRKEDSLILSPQQWYIRFYLGVEGLYYCSRGVTVREGEDRQYYLTTTDFVCPVPDACNVTIQSEFT